MIAILVNPASGNGKAEKINQKIIRILNSKKIQHKVFVGDWPLSLSSFTEAWIVGGDGTVNYFLNYYRENSIPIAVFPGGTGNDFCWQLYGNLKVEELVEKVILSIPKAVDTGTCNEKLYINSSGIGFDGEVLKSMSSIRRLGGHLGYLWVVIRQIFRFKEFHFTIETGETIFKEKLLLLAVNNASRTGGGFFVTPQASVTDGKLNLLMCKPLSVFKRLLYLPKIEKGRHLHLDVITHKLVNSIKISADQPVYAQLDGELMQAQNFEFKVCPGWLMVKY